MMKSLRNYSFWISQTRDKNFSFPKLPSVFPIAQTLSMVSLKNYSYFVPTEDSYCKNVIQIYGIADNKRVMYAFLFSFKNHIGFINCFKITVRSLKAKLKAL